MTDPLIVFSQEKTWPYLTTTVRQPLYVVVQLLELRDGYYDMSERDA